MQVKPEINSVGMIHTQVSCNGLPMDGSSPSTPCRRMMCEQKTIFSLYSSPIANHCGQLFINHPHVSSIYLPSSKQSALPFSPTCIVTTYMNVSASERGVHEVSALQLHLWWTLTSGMPLQGNVQGITLHIFPDSKDSTSRTHISSRNGIACYGKFKVQTNNSQTRKCSMKFPKRMNSEFTVTLGEHFSKCGTK